MTHTVPLDKVLGPTMPVPLPCPLPGSDGCGLGPLTGVASMPVVLALSTLL